MATVVVVVAEEERRGIGAHVGTCELGGSASAKALDSDVDCWCSRLSSGLLCCTGYTVELEKEYGCDISDSECRWKSPRCGAASEFA